jgi:hypothetical protein
MLTPENFAIAFAPPGIGCVKKQNMVRASMEIFKKTKNPSSTQSNGYGSIVVIDALVANSTSVVTVL